jgi:hypothetical protein
MADKVTWQDTVLHPCQIKEIKGYVSSEDEIVVVAQAQATWEVAYKAGQKEAVTKVLDKLHLNEIDTYDWNNTSQEYPKLLADTVKEIKKEWGIV